MKRSKISAKWQIFLYLLVFCAILIGLLWLLQVAHLDSFYKFIKKHESQRTCDQLESIIQLEQDEEVREKEIDNIALQHNISVILTNEKLNYFHIVEHNKSSSMMNMPTSLFQACVLAAKQNGGSFSVRFVGDEVASNGIENYSYSIKDKTIYPGTNSSGDFQQNIGNKSAESIICVRIIPGNNTRNSYILMVNAALTPVNSTVETLKVQLLFITGVLIVLSIALGLIVSNMVSQPIVKANEAAKRLAEGDFSMNLKEEQYREIAELSKTLNYAAEELSKTDRYRKELIANVSHDLRTPLTMITGYAEVMRDLPGENTPENIQVIVDEANRLTTLVNDMLNISKIQAGVMELNETTYNLTESIQKVLFRYNALRKQEGYVIEFDAAEEVIVTADEEKIYQVLYNLVNNAINYTGKDKRVVVRQVCHKDKVRIEIIDSGEGIPQEELQNVWERYYKVDKTHRRCVQGTGLGLSIVKSILKLHNAQFGVESEVGKGSTFWFELNSVKE